MTRRDLLLALGAAPWRPGADDRKFLEDLQRRSFQFFLDHSDPATGLVRDRAQTSGEPIPGPNADIASIASTGFGLTALCIAAEHGWISRPDARKRALRTLQFFAGTQHKNGWFYHFVDMRTGERRWNCELSSIDTALLFGGIVTAGQYFARDGEVASLARTLYERLDFAWMLNGHPHLLSHGWKPETGWLKNRWDEYCELMVLYVLAIGSPTHPIPPESWYAWKRPWFEYGPFRYVRSVPPLFVHQFSHAWVDFRGVRERGGINWFENSAAATRAQRLFCSRLASEFPKSYSEEMWGITASDSAHGYLAWGGPPRDPQIDGTLVPCAPAGSLMFTPDITVPTLVAMRRRFGDRVWGRYAFTDAFNPTTGWVNRDVIGIDLGITILSAENLLTGNVWRWFMSNEAVQRAMRAAGFTRA